MCKKGLDPLSDKPLCEACWNKIEFNLPPFCRICGKHLPAPHIRRQAGLPLKNHALTCKDCQGALYSFSKARSVCVYEGIIKECVRLFKYKSKLSLVNSLAKLLIDAAHNYLDMQNIDLVLPVPLCKSKFRQRQFNQAEVLARPLSRAFSKELKDKLLIKIKPGPAQANLSRPKRLKNVRGSFKVNNAGYVKNKNILLIDDVLTTAATANECAKMLLEAGANRVDVFTLARGA